MQERKVVLMPATSAKVGYTFVKWTGDTDCASCPLYKFCGGDLNPKKTYQVVGVREAGRECPKTGEQLKAVEIAESPALVVVPRKGLLKGVTIQYKRVACKDPFNKYYYFCAAKNLQDGDKLRVEEIVEPSLNVEGQDCALIRATVRSEAGGRQRKDLDHFRYFDLNSFILDAIASTSHEVMLNLAKSTFQFPPLFIQR